MVAVFWVGVPVEVTQETGVVPRCRCAAIGTPFLSILLNFNGKNNHL